MWVKWAMNDGVDLSSPELNRQLVQTKTLFSNNNKLYISSNDIDENDDEQRNHVVVCVCVFALIQTPIENRQP